MLSITLRRSIHLAGENQRLGLRSESFPGLVKCVQTKHLLALRLSHTITKVLKLAVFMLYM